MQSFKIISIQPTESIGAPVVLIEGPMSARVSSEVGLGDEVFGQSIRLETEPPAEAERKEYSVEFQWETSMFIDDEGPHLDLLEWKHHTSEWTPLRRNDAGEFSIPELSDSDRQSFPDYTVDELRRVVSQIGGERWLEVIGEVGPEPEHPLRIGVSKVRFRILKAGSSTVLNVIEISLPLGT